jgi:hypothetical protein
MSYLPLMEVDEALYKLTHKLDDVSFKWNQIVIYNGLQIASRSAANITNGNEQSLITV